MEYHKRSVSRDGLQAYCKVCNCKNRTEAYRRNRGTERDSQKKRRLEWRKRLYDHLLDHPCVECGEANPILLEFDHVRGKKYDSVSRMVMHGYAWASIEEEMSKCEVRCVRCHRLKTASEGGWFKHLQDSPTSMG